MKTSAAARIPFTLAFALVMVGAGVATASWHRPVDPHVLSRWGFDLHDLWDGRWYCLVTGDFLCNRPAMFWGMLVFLLASVGGYEWRCGTRRAAVLYWVTDLSGTLLVTFGMVLPLYLSGTALGRQLAFSGDVGMSGGGFGCLGAFVHTLSPRWRARCVVLVVVYLIAHALLTAEPFADAVHMVTFPGGYWLDWKLGRLALPDRLA